MHWAEKAFRILYSEYGRQHWWPAETPFEVCVGAILTQNTSWKNVEKAIANLRKMRLLSPEAMLSCEDGVLEAAIRPAGFYSQKARRLKEFCKQVSLGELDKMGIAEARKKLLSVHGIGKETADSILLYALGKPIFVVDAYTRRIYERITGESAAHIRYDELREQFEGALGGSAQKYNEMHALLVEHAKLYCTKSCPKCGACPLKPMCTYPKQQFI
ncbi:MAG: endonuclease III domain-containing protein [Candidatus Micrarchaeota archaeon]|nr:endonuclease III domain-containing protein [Candidatus Micrarchaeota archaeon]